jgi:hypothetical protein
MPTFQKSFEHRDKLLNETPWFNAMIARPVCRKEVDSNPKAQEAVLKEWERLRDQGTWDEKEVREWREVAQRVKSKGIKAHVGRIFEIVVEKGSELPLDHPARKFKGRVVYQGSNVRDEYGANAIFNELSSCPANMQAGKACDAYGLIEGHDEELCDAVQAYIQADLGTTLRLADGNIQQVETWVRIPKNRQPKGWSKFVDPVVPLRKALYGHPDSGGYWESHCTTQLRQVGFEPIPSWDSCFYHPKLELFLVVYVDDFKMSGPSKNLSKG